MRRLFDGEAQLEQAAGALEAQILEVESGLRYAWEGGVATQLASFGLADFLLRP